MSALRAFVIEDDQAVSAVYMEALRQAGYEVEIIGNGRTALNRLHEVIPALLLLDLHLPEVDGIQVLTEVQADGRLADTRIFLITADHLLAEQLRDQVQMVLLKPVSFTQLRDTAVRFRPASPKSSA